MTKEQIIAAAKSLPADDRAEVIAAINPANDEFVMTDALRAELDRRIAEYEAHPERVISWEALKARWAAERQPVSR